MSTKLKFDFRAFTRVWLWLVIRDTASLASMGLALVTALLLFTLVKIVRLEDMAVSGASSMLWLLGAAVLVVLDLVLAGVLQRKLEE